MDIETKDAYPRSLIVEGDASQPIHFPTQQKAMSLLLTPNHTVNIKQPRF